ncbi:MAG: YeeE/YedE family protein [Gammaproteobacteria bacterium]|nr:YeeE/YedE family protein [Gammaproteobacteria bacterium]NNM13052.1 YeeE/YedE family protein [Gammaproteobacteria bacterium]
MNPTEFTPWLSLIGGMLLGISTIWLMFFHGRIAGISGIIKTALFNKPGRLWRIMFIIGIVFGSLVFYHFTPMYFDYREGFPKGLIVIGGLLVGIGTALGSGCTSGHGICGISRVSNRSILATAVYLLVGVIAAIVTSQFFL